MIHDFIYLWTKELLLEIPEVSDIKWDWGQDVPGNAKDKLNKMPALLLSFPGEVSVDAELQDGQQEMTIPMYIKVVTKNQKDGDKHIHMPGSKANNFAIARSVFTQLTEKQTGKISEISSYKQLNGTSSDYEFIDTISRTGVATIHRINGAMITSLQRFNLVVVDFSGKITKNRKIINPTVGDLEFFT